MTDTAIAEFIAAYDEAAYERIRFNWNGKYGGDFDDPNFLWRKEVLAAVLRDPHGVPLELLRDVFIAETEFARLANYIDEGVGDLATALLARGRSPMLRFFLHGGTQGLQAYYECLTAEVEPELARELAASTEAMFAEYPDPDAQTYMQAMRNFFLSKAG